MYDMLRSQECPYLAQKPENAAKILVTYIMHEGMNNTKSA